LLVRRWSAQESPRLQPWGEVNVYGFFLFLAFTIFFASVFTRFWQEVFKRKVLSGTSLSLGYFIVFVVGSGEVLRYCSLVYGGFTSAAETGYWSGVLYGMSWVVDNGLANAGQIWDWSVSDIQPITGTTGTLVWGYNIVLAFFAIAAITRAVQVVRAYSRHTRTAHNSTSDAT
jgi:hypothetical protein